MNSCAESISQRRNTVSLRCDRSPSHQELSDGPWHYDADVDADWMILGGLLVVRYRLEGACI